jgi:hypothetical protein
VSRAGLTALLALALLAAVPAAAGAHSIVRFGGAAVTYLAADATSLNSLTAGASGGRITFRDPTVDGGIDPGPCDPTEVSDDANSWIIAVSCPQSGLTRVEIDLGEREDVATVDLPLPVKLVGGLGSDQLRAGGTADEVTGDQGNDRLAGGGGNDSVSAGDGDDVADGEGGNDVIDGGLGYDEVTGGEGDDELRTADGLADKVNCGPGGDRVDADTVDEVDASCENVTRRLVPPPPDSESTAGDVTPPTVLSGGSTLQRLKRSGKVRLLATTSERGFLGASGFLDTAGVSLPLQSERKQVDVGGGGVKLTVKLSKRQRKLARRSLRRGRRAVVRMWAVGTDLAGNSARAKSMKIRLRRR